MTVRPQDLGGALGLGPVPVEQDEPVWHAPWEGTVVAGILATIAAGLYNVDQFREAIDDLDPLPYVSLGYYGRWLHTLERNCERSGVLTSEEVDERMQELAAGRISNDPGNPSVAEGLRTLIREGAPGTRPVDRAPRFATGDAVRGRSLPGERHARIPGYAQGKSGVVHRVHEAFVFPDANRRGEGESPEHVYSVRFEGNDLWPGEGAGAVYIDLWESYLEPREDA
jgi:nitrile hydratase